MMGETKAWLPPILQERKANKNNDFNNSWLLNALWSPHTRTHAHTTVWLWPSNVTLCWMEPFWYSSAVVLDNIMLYFQADHSTISQTTTALGHMRPLPFWFCDYRLFLILNLECQRVCLCVREGERIVLRQLILVSTQQEQQEED